MHISQQNAEIIYNIGGNLELHSSPEIIKLLKQGEQERLKELNSISYFEILKKELAGKKLIYRNSEIEKIKSLLEEKRQILLFGDPGIGKTTAVFQLAEMLKNLVYVSVKSKSPISVISYLLNKVRLSHGDELVEVTDLDKGLEWLQVSLQKSTQCFIIDDCEQDKGIVSKLISLSKFDSSFLFVTRNETLFESSGIATYPWVPFSEIEVQQYLESHGLGLTKLEISTLFRVSKGNPLYLFYFSHYKLSPLPDSLIEYQNSIWGGLSAAHREIIALIAISYFSISITELSEVLSHESDFSLLNEIDVIAPLIKNFNGSLELFHPTFNEFIIEKLESKGLLNGYKQKLGNYYLEKEEIVHATSLLIDLAPEKVDKYLYDVFPILISWGELSFALRVLKTKLINVERDLDKGYLYYHLCHVHHLLGNRDESTSCIDKSLEHLKRANSAEMLPSALMFKAMNLIDSGEINEAIEIADKVFSDTTGADEKSKAPLLVNLSKIYVDLSEFEKGASACKEAFQIFEKDGNREGMVSSLVNLVTCLGQIHEYRNEAEEYGLKALKLFETATDPSFEVVVLNALASIYREKKDYPKAKEFNNRAIELCQKHEMKDKVIMNLINYGNVLRDEGDISGARKVYEEALIKCKEYNLKRDEGRIYWIFCSIERKAGNFPLSLEYADKSIIINKEINFHYGVANALREKADTFLLNNEPLKAAEALIESASYYAKIEQFSKLYQYNISKAINIYKVAGDTSKVNELINLLLQNMVAKADIMDTVDLILDNSSDDTISDNFEKLFTVCFANGKQNQNVLRSFISFVGYCQGLDEVAGKKLFEKIFDLVIQNIGKTKSSHGILGIAIEQSGRLLDKNKLDSIFGLLSNKLPMFSAREVNEEVIFITSIAEKINLEIHTFSDEETCQKLAIALILVLHELPELIMDNERFKENYCTITIHSYAAEMKNALSKYLPDDEEFFNKDMQSGHMDKKDYDMPEMILISPEYETKCNLNSYPDNKVSMFYFTRAVMGIKSHFYHSKVREDSGQRRFILNSIARLFDYTNVELDNETKKSIYEIEIDKIDLT